MANNNEPDNSYRRWSGLAFQMAAATGGGVWLGLFLDEKTESISFPVFTVALSLLGTAAALWIVIKQTMPKDQ